jgi:S-adenosylmethionine synthetase
MELFFAGRATPVEPRDTLEEITQRVCNGFFGETFRKLDPCRHVRVHQLIRPGSAELVELFARQQTGGPFCNDTSCGVGYAPSSPLETTILSLEQELNQSPAKDAHPFIGEDIKLMGVRRDQHLDLTVACAILDSYVSDVGEYVAAKRELGTLVGELLAARGWQQYDVSVNAADDPGLGSLYLTVTGTSAESGDDGEAGRGNRGDGLIAPGRPMTMESLAGKNPLTHVGKLYNLMAGSIARCVFTELTEVAEAQCMMVSRIGRPVAEPAAIYIQVRTHVPVTASALRPVIERLVEAELAGSGDLWRAIVAADIKLF